MSSQQSCAVVRYTYYTYYTKDPEYVLNVPVAVTARVAPAELEKALPASFVASVALDHPANDEPLGCLEA